MAKVKIILTGNNRYLTWLSGHLKKEHPKTKKLMKVRGLK